MVAVVGGVPAAVGHALPAVAVVGPLPPHHRVDAQLLAVGQRARGDPVAGLLAGHLQVDGERVGRSDLPGDAADPPLVVEADQESGGGPGPRLDLPEPVHIGVTPGRGRSHGSRPSVLGSRGQPGRLHQPGHLEFGRQRRGVIDRREHGRAGHRSAGVVGGQLQQPGGVRRRVVRLRADHHGGHGNGQRPADDHRNGDRVTQRARLGHPVSGRGVVGQWRGRPGADGAVAGRRHTGGGDRGHARSPVHVPAAEDTEPSHVLPVPITRPGGRRLGGPTWIG